MGKLSRDSSTSPPWWAFPVVFTGFGFCGFFISQFAMSPWMHWQSANQFRSAVVVPAVSVKERTSLSVSNPIMQPQGSDTASFPLPVPLGSDAARLLERKAQNPPKSFLRRIWGPPLNHTDQVASDGFPMVDVVSLTLAEDFNQVLHNEGLQSWLRHLKNIRSITFIAPSQDIKFIENHLKETQISNDVTIQAFDEIYFRNVYYEPHGVPYHKVFQQLIKLHVFDIPGLLFNVVILDSDTVWAQDHVFVYHNGSGNYVNNYYHKPDENIFECNGMDPVDWINNMLKDTPCSFYKYCGKPNSNGARHILHHMVFQRDVMMDLHRTVMASYEASSLWQAVQLCWKSPGKVCQGRVAEYELYYTFTDCKYHSRVVDTFPMFVASANNCTVAEMELCKQKGLLLKMCNDGADKLPWKRGECSEAAPGLKNW